MFPVSTLLPIAIRTATTVAGQLADSAARGVSFARVLADKPNPDATKPAANGTAQLDAAGPADLLDHTRYSTLRRGLEESRRALEPRLTERFQQAGIDLSEPIVLELDQFGHVLETSGHLDRDKIERVLESDPQLAQSVRQLLRQAEQLDSAQVRRPDDGQRSVAQLVVIGRTAQLHIPGESEPRMNADERG